MDPTAEGEDEIEQTPALILPIRVMGDAIAAETGSDRIDFLLVQNEALALKTAQRPAARGEAVEVADVFQKRRRDVIKLREHGGIVRFDGLIEWNRLAKRSVDRFRTANGRVLLRGEDAESLTVFSAGREHQQKGRKEQERFLFHHLNFTKTGKDCNRTFPPAFVRVFPSPT